MAYRSPEHHYAHPPLPELAGTFPPPRAPVTLWSQRRQQQREEAPQRQHSRGVSMCIPRPVFWVLCHVHNIKFSAIYARHYRQSSGQLHNPPHTKKYTRRISSARFYGNRGIGGKHTSSTGAATHDSTLIDAVGSVAA